MQRGQFVRLMAGAAGGAYALPLSAMPGFEVDVPYSLMVKIRVGNKAVPGFVAKLEGKNYVFTCTTLILGHDRFTFETVKGEPIKPLKIEMSPTRDIARFLIDSADGLKTESAVSRGDTVSAVEYSSKHGGMDSVPLEVESIDDDYMNVVSLGEKKPYGAPVLSEEGGVCGIARVYDHYKMNEDLWEPKPVQRVYPLEESKWVAPPWKKYNNKFGEVLSGADEFRREIYALSKVWLEEPSEKLPLDESMARDIQQWVKHHNSMVNRCYNARRNAANKEDPYHGIRNNFRDNCLELGGIVKDKADTLKFLTQDKFVTPFMYKELMWRYLEMHVFAEYILRQRKKANNIH